MPRKIIKFKDNKIPDGTTSIKINQFNTDKQNFKKRLDKKIPNTSGLMTTAIYNTKTGEFDNKIPNVSGLVKKKTDYKDRKSDTDGYYLTTSDYKKCKKKILHARIKKKWLLEKSNISNLLKKIAI